jgi:hypothetical protein
MTSYCSPRGRRKATDDPRRLLLPLICINCKTHRFQELNTITRAELAVSGSLSEAAIALLWHDRTLSMHLLLRSRMEQIHTITKRSAPKAPQTIHCGSCCLTYGAEG